MRRFREYIKESLDRPVKHTWVGWKEDLEKEGKYPDKFYKTAGASVWAYESRSNTLYWYNPKKHQIWANGDLWNNVLDFHPESWWKKGRATHNKLQEQIDKDIYEERRHDMTSWINGRTYKGETQAWYDAYEPDIPPYLVKRYDNIWNRAIKAAKRYIK